MSDTAEAEREREPHAPHNSPVPAVGVILPGTVHVVAIEPHLTTDGVPLPRWRVTLHAVAQPEGREHDLADLQGSISFTTADPLLIRLIRAQKLRYVLDLIQLQREGPEVGEVEDS